MIQSCICYTADPGYLLPTYVSALQARRHASAAIADVLIFCIGDPGQAGRRLEALCAAENIGFAVIQEASIDGADAMMARLFLDRITPAAYRQLLYIDGDTQIVGSLDPLLAARLPAGHFMAAKDPLAFSIPANDPGSEQGAYLSSVGLPPDAHGGYFNSGVLRIDREGWDEIGMAAWQVYRRLRGRSRFPDQDALNLAGKGRRIPMSLAWNFPIFLRNAAIEPLIQPRIIHFPGRPKPWHGSFAPWGSAGFAPYREALLRHPELAALSEPISRARHLKYRGQQNYKRISEWLAWSQGFRKQAMLSYEANLAGPELAAAEPR